MKQLLNAYVFGARCGGALGDRPLPSGCRWSAPILLGAWCLALTLSATECVWEGASGNWSGDGWKDGVRPTNAGDTVKITGADVILTVGDADAANFQLVTKVTIDKPSSQLLLDMSAGTPIDVPAIFEGNGTLVKKGTATVNLTTTGDSRLTLLGNLMGGLIVSNGTVQLPNRTDLIELKRAEASGSGVLSLGSTPTFTISRGLWGDGTVRQNYAGTQIYFYSTDHNNPPVFSGHFEGKVNLTPYFYSGNSCIQYLTGTTDTNMTLRIYGTLGAKTLGAKDGASSVGTGSLLFRSGVAQLHCLNETDETTTKNFQFYGEAASSIIKASPYGGMTFKGTWNLPAYTSFGPTYFYNTITLTGENTARANILTFTDAYDSDSRSTVYWNKAGTGIWRFANFKPAINGTFEVRRGTLEFDSLAERGDYCALGTATRTGPDVGSWVSADRSSTAGKVPRVPYAYRLGNAERVPLTTADDYLPTMQYIGAAAATCTTRPFVIDGVGRILTTNGVLSLAGASAFTNGTHTLVLDGAAATTNLFASVTNGPLGTLNVVKRGTGKWTLLKDVAIGMAAAEQGTLQIGAAYQFYRWTITCNNQKAGGQWIAAFNGFALMDKDRNMVNGTVGSQGVMLSDKLNKPWLLAPGEMCYGRTTYASTGNRYPAKSFWWLPDEQKFKGSAASIDVTVKKDDESTHPIVYWRVDEGVEVAEYDVLACGGDATARARAVSAWALAGSVDGTNWDVLHVIDDDSYCGVMGNNQWYSDKSSGATPRTGFAIPVGDTNTTFAVGSVRAAKGATVAFVGNAAGTAVSNIVLNAAGGGTIKGAAIAAKGTLDLTNWDRDTYNQLIALDLSGCTGWDHIENWTVKAGDKTLNRRIRVTEAGVTVMSSGFILVVH